MKVVKVHKNSDRGSVARVPKWHNGAGTRRDLSQIRVRDVVVCAEGDQVIWSAAS
jgi:hypothetical protein